MPATLLGPDQLTDYLPHRGVNLIVDQVSLAEDRRWAESQIEVPADDARGRTMLARRDGAGERCWYEPFLGEVLALTGVCLLKEGMGPGEVGVFSAISRFTMTRVPPQGDQITARATISRSRGDFTQFGAEVIDGDERLLHCEVMSGTGRFTDISATPLVPLEGPLGEAPQADFGWKDPRVRFIDGVREADADGGRLLATYVYPDDHPFIPGHFPDAAIMMGVTQWAAVADAGWEAACRFGLGPVVSISGGIRKSDGTEVVDIRDLRLDASDGVPAIVATKRVAFRSPVVPGDGLLIEVTVQAC